MTDHLDVLLTDGVIDEVLGRLKSGKEANISLVRRGDDVLAAKVYKDRSTRSFKNNADYKEGRKVRNSRTQRAIDGGGRFGRDAAEQAWKSAEADALYKLVGSGVRVPVPVMFYEGVLLMELVKDGEGRPAPRMIDVAIESSAAVGVYADLVAQIIAMLCCDLIHGDLSPYNILAAADGPTIIDFPQVVSAVHSSRAEFFFLRDFDNVVRFVSGFDPTLAVHRHDGRAIWRAYVGRELTREFVPPPPPPPQARGSGPNRWRGQGSDPRPDQRRGDGRQPRPPQDSRRADPRGPQDQGRPNGPPRSEPWSPQDPRRSNGASPDPRSSSDSPQSRDPRSQDPRWPDRSQQGPGPQGSGPPRSGYQGSRPQGPGYQGSRPQGSGYQGSRPQGSGYQRSGPPGSGPPGSGPPGSGPPRSRQDQPRTAYPEPVQPRRSGPPSDLPPRQLDPRRDQAPPPPRQPSQPREWSNRPPAPAAPAPSRGKRRRPKRHW
jgi:RIO kinase 1